MKKNDKKKTSKTSEPGGVLRLRALLQETRDSSCERGAASGHDWANDKANPEELARLQKAVGRQANVYAAAVAADSRGAATRLYADVTGAPPGQWIDPDDVSDYWGAHADDLVDATAVEAFVRAALAVWALVQD